jgi:hypothetical protein
MNKEYINLHGRTYQINILENKENGLGVKRGKQHMVSFALCLEDQQMYCLKECITVNKSGSDNIIRADVLGHKKINNFLNSLNEPLPLRIARLCNEPDKDRIMVMEFIKADATYDWQGSQPIEEMAPLQKNMLENLRTIFTTVFQREFDLGDFKPDNVIWNNNTFVIIDYTHEVDSSETENNILSYIVKWSLENTEVARYLCTDLPEVAKDDVLTRMAEIAAYNSQATSKS